MEAITYPVAQIDLTLDDMSVLQHVKSLLRQMRGVRRVSVRRPKAASLASTSSYKAAMADVEAGRVTEWNSLEEFFAKMKD